MRGKGSIIFLGILSVWAALSASAQAVIPIHTIRPGEILRLEDVRASEDTKPGFVSDVQAVVGMEARRILYAGRPIKRTDVGPPALVERNQVVVLIYSSPALSIRTEGRALERGAIGDVLRVINLTSRNTVFGRVDASGYVIVEH